MISFSIHNFGCRVNQAEAFSWSIEFQKHGLKLEKEPGQSDFVLINTCTLTSRADRDVRKFIRKVTRLNPQAKLIITGCSVEQAYEEFKEIPQTWHLFPNREKRYLAEKVLSSLSLQGKSSILPFRSRALLKIQDGCNFRCTFCIIPKVRGESTSLEKAEIISQTKNFINQGFREIVFTGIHLSSYGQYLKSRSSLLELLQEIENLEGLGKIRLSSLDPRFLDLPLLEFLTGSKKICPHFHLSLQHGSNRILRLMGRRTRAESYQEILSYLRQNSPHSSLGADILVGFPGEGEDDFRIMYELLQKSPLAYFHVFPYSPRPETPASDFPQVGEKLKRERASSLRKLSAQKNLSFRQSFLGREIEAIVVKKENGSGEVLTSNYIKVFASPCPWQEGEEVRVKIISVRASETIGQISS